MWKLDGVVAGRMNSTRIVCILNKDNRRSYMTRTYTSAYLMKWRRLEFTLEWIVAAARGQSPSLMRSLSGQASVERMSFVLRTVRGRLRGRLGGRLFCLHRCRVLWRQVRDGLSVQLELATPPREGVPTIGHSENPEEVRFRPGLSSWETIR